MSVEMEKTTQLEQVATLPGVRLPAVNLMPQQVAAESKLRRTQLILGGATLLVLAGVAGIAALSYAQVNSAQDELSVAQARTTELQKEEAKYVAVPTTLSEIDQLQNAQAQAMSTDIAWYQQLDLVNQEFPQDMKFKSLTVTLNGAGTTVATTTDPLATPNTIGTMSVEGYGPTYPNTASWLDALTAHPGFVDPYYSTADLAYDDTLKKNIVNVSSTVSLTSDLLTHRFDRKAQ